MHATVRLLLPLLLLVLTAPAAFGQNNSPTRLYDEVLRSTHVLNACGEMTPERQEWFDHLMVLAKRRIEHFTDEEKARHDAAIAADIAREFPRKPSQSYCNDFARRTDVERKALARDK